MNEFFYNLIFFLIPIVTIGLPILLSIWIYRKMKRKNVKKVWYILAVVPILIVVYFLLMPGAP